MPCFLGIDTSNYTTSCAIYDSENDTIIHRKKLLPVKKGELGLRQSDAVFHHTVQLPELMKELFADFDGEIDAIGVSDAPMRAEGSYMPCFLTGVCAAESIAAATGKPLYRFSHQQGHIMAALFSSGRRELYGKDFFAFHVSGGTTQALLVSGELDARLIASSLDLKAGQAVDRVGVMLGYPFPVVMVSVTDRSLRSYTRKHILRRDESDCKLLTVPGFSLVEYREWHAGEVEGLPLLSESV